MSKERSTVKEFSNYPAPHDPSLSLISRNHPAQTPCSWHPTAPFFLSTRTEQNSRTPFTPAVRMKLLVLPAVLKSSSLSESREKPKKNCSASPSYAQPASSLIFSVRTKPSSHTSSHRSRHFSLFAWTAVQAKRSLFFSALEGISNLLKFR
ncbi:hypothetical protein KFK09_023996 [Dendrobium nobile]|uniref:Uncharacterized protein n=1 Tax=Dendrobium nobile TaxID=94219 RepID=A0A8T3A3H6_DENNO|nr:hypothetical protein KFK09_028428 [Dendrobium nobile]KAI0493870.1 hypothetical protein KFK09_023996 [Dendrobium nobile]